MRGRGSDSSIACIKTGNGKRSTIMAGSGWMGEGRENNCIGVHPYIYIDRSTDVDRSRSQMSQRTNATLSDKRSIRSTGALQTVSFIIHDLPVSHPLWIYPGLAPGVVSQSHIHLHVDLRSIPSGPAVRLNIVSRMIKRQFRMTRKY